jgi:hypothetical protein
LTNFLKFCKPFFAAVPYNIHLKHEKYYQTIFYLIFRLIGLRIEAEVHTNKGRIDAVVEMAAQVYIFEFKLDKSAGEALEQIRSHEYARKYQAGAKPVILFGANFDSAQRVVNEWRSESMEK